MSTVTIRKITLSDQATWDRLVHFPVQSFAWAESRVAIGQKILTLGVYEGETLVSVVLVLVKKIPGTRWSFGTILRGALYDDTIYETLKTFGRENHIAYFCFEPNAHVSESSISPLLTAVSHGQFARWTAYLDLAVPYETLEKNFSKTVRNESRLAQKTGIHIVHGTDSNLFADFLTLVSDTSKRKNFHGYSSSYYQAVFKSLREYKQAVVFVAYTGEGKAVAAALVFVFKDTLYYAYAGGQGRETPRGTMYLLVTSIIQYGQKAGKARLDLFGTLDPNDTSKHPWSGFTQFKKSFGPVFVEYIGRYDLIVSPLMYRLHKAMNTLLVFLKKIMYHKGHIWTIIKINIFHQKRKQNSKLNS